MVNRGYTIWRDFREAVGILSTVRIQIMQLCINLSVDVGASEVAARNRLVQAYMAVRGGVCLQWALALVATFSRVF